MVKNGREEMRKPKHEEIRRNESFTDDNIIRGRTITMRNIDILYDDGRHDGCDPPCKGWSPIVPALGPMLDLLQANPTIDDVSWTGKQWVAT